jgi:hypothetical protein
MVLIEKIMCGIFVLLINTTPRMKKIILGILLTITTLSSFGQNTTTSVTRHVSTDKMVWSDSDEKWVFISNEDRRNETVVWEFTLDEDRTGKIKANSVDTEDIYTFTVYNWEIRVNDSGLEYLWIEMVQNVNNEKGTFMINVYPEGRVYSAFLPKSNLVVYFDNLPN